MKGLRRHYSLKVAEMVVDVLDRLICREGLKGKGVLLVECFDNCREQGLVVNVIKVGPPSFYLAVAQNRNSDDIVVYAYNKTVKFSNLPTEDGWEDKRFFKVGNYLKAAKYMKSRIDKFLS